MLGLGLWLRLGFRVLVRFMIRKSMNVYEFMKCLCVIRTCVSLKRYVVGRDMSQYS